MKLDDLFSIAVFGIAMLIGFIGSLLSLIYNISALTYADFDMSAQTYSWLGFWISVYSHIPALILLAISRAFKRIGGDMLLVGIVVFTQFVNLIVFLKFG